MKQYLDAVRYVLDNGTRKENRTGVDTLSCFNVNYTIDLKKGFPLMTTKSVSWKNIVVEMLWFLSGSDDIKLLWKHGCKFWDAWADENGKVPSAYGAFWTNFPAGSEPETIESRQSSGNDYEKPVFSQLLVQTNHKLCGKIFESKNNGNFKIIEHKGTDSEGRALFDIQFITTGYVKRAVRQDVIFNGTIRDRYVSVIHGVGYYGEPTAKTGIEKDLLKVWLHMMDRCYNVDCKEYPWYGLKGITVCKRWWNYSNFHSDCMRLTNWINKKKNPKQYALDKDFFSSNCYSPNTCVWLLHSDNRLYAHSKPIEISFPDRSKRIVLSSKDAVRATGINKSRILTCMKRNEEYRNYKFTSPVSKYPYRNPLPNNQIKYVIDQLQTNPLSRRMVVSAWAPGNAQTSALPPCHSVFMVNVQDVENDKEICLHLSQRSADIALGVPYNIASYALLIELFARFSGIRAGRFGHTMVDAHIYVGKPDGSMSEYDHIPGLREQLTRTPKALPKLIISDDIKCLDDVEALMHEDTATVMSKFILEGYNPDPAIKFKVAV